MILVTGQVTARPDTIAEMLRVSTEHVHRSRAEPGCISHHVSVDADDPLRLHFIERWEDAAALKAHFRVKESQIMWKALQSLAADPGAMHLYEASEVSLSCSTSNQTVMAALVAAIHFPEAVSVFMDGRDKPGHDDIMGHDNT